MATVAQNLSFYNESNIFSSVPSMSTSCNPMLVMNENGTVSFGSALGGQSLLSSFTDVSNFGSTWPELYAPTSFFNSSIQTSSSVLPLSESSVYTTDDVPAADFLLMGSSDSEFLQQINGSSSVAAVMHPNLVSTLKNMVAPGPGSPRQSGTSALQFSFFDQQPSQGSSLFTHCHQPSEQKAPLDVDASKLVDTISPICSSQPVKVLGWETFLLVSRIVQNVGPFKA